MSDDLAERQTGLSLKARLLRSAMLVAAFGALAVYTAKFRHAQAAQTVIQGVTPVRHVASANRSLQLVYHAVDDVTAESSGERFSYIGSWQHVTGARDGRSGGTSSRSFEPGSLATLQFSGDRFKLYGVTGGNGGRGEIVIDGHRAGIVSFYSASKAVNVAVFESGRLEPGAHSVAIIVMAELPALKSRRFVNLDGAAIHR